MCMDALESVARSQFFVNMRLVENYEMVKGKFIFSHYFEQDDYVDMISQLTKEFELPSYLRHYDIISQIINTLEEEYFLLPDTFRVKAHDENTGNEYVRTQTDLLLKYVVGKINTEVERKLLDMGFDSNKQDFDSQEQRQQYQQALEQARKQLTPPQIQDYMKNTWYTAGEAWGDHQLGLDRERFRLNVKERVELRDMFIADRCFRHFYLTPVAYEQETWNPVNVFYHKSPDVDNIEEGDYVGRIFWLTIPDIIDRYGYLMKKKQIESLQEYLKVNDRKWDYAAGTEYVYQNYMFPFKGYPAYDIIRQTQTFTNLDSNLPYLDSTYLSSLYSGRFFNETKGYYFVIESYWKSHEKLGKVIYTDPLTGLKAKALVDENFIVPEGFTELDSTFSDDTEDLNTVTWTWVNRVWKGIKLCTKSHTGFTEDIYLDVAPLEFQFKGDRNPYSAKLPVCGQIFSVRNSQSMSLVDLVKPHQIGYNVAVNQGYAEMQKDYGKFIIMDVNMFPDIKDWGGEQAYERFMMMAKELGVTLADTSSPRQSAAVAGGHLPKEIDLDASARIMNRLKIAEYFEQMALRQIGFNQYRTGQYGSSATEGGVKEGLQASRAATGTYFTQFSNYLQRCYKMGLDIAQYVQAQNKDVTVSYVKSDLSRAFVKIAGTDLLLSDLHVYVSNSQEEARQLEALRKLALSNNTTDASILDLADIITTMSPAKIRIKLQESYDRQQEKLERQFELEQQKLEQEKQIKQFEEQKEDERIDKQIVGKENVAYIQATASIPTEPVPNPEDQNALAQQKVDNQKQSDQQRAQQSNAKLTLERDAQRADAEYKLKKLELEQRKVESGLAIEHDKLNYARVMKGKQEKPKPVKKTKKP